MNFVQKNEELGLYAPGAEEYMSTGYQYIRLPVSGVNKSQLEADAERESHELLLEQAEEIYEKGLLRFPTSTMSTCSFFVFRCRCESVALKVSNCRH